jgi:hypothetical protein
MCAVPIFVDTRVGPGMEPASRGESGSGEYRCSAGLASWAAAEVGCWTSLLLEMW